MIPRDSRKIITLNSIDKNIPPIMNECLSSIDYDENIIRHAYLKLERE